MTLYEGKTGQEYTVENLCLAEAVTRRFEAIGIFEGTKIKILNKKQAGAMIIRARGARWAIGRENAEGIFVKEFTNENNN